MGEVSSMVAWTGRLLVGAVLVLLGIFSLPLTALVFDGEGATRLRGALVGVLAALVGAVIGLVMYFILLSGFDSM
ncbi:hypothetical protein [Ornithinibacter aureus]|nr:hypothetical protein [Ornithinibacter aureus]KAF0834779.1 hypothetical protein C8E84_2622 [Ornithinibacter aureus]